MSLKGDICCVLDFFCYICKYKYHYSYNSVFYFIVLCNVIKFVVNSK